MERHVDRARRTLREELLDAAADLTVGGGYRGLRMTDVAAAAGVSRQTVYNEFSGKDGLAKALVLREAERYLDGVDEAMSAHGELYDAVAAAIAFTLRAAADNPLLKAVLTGEDSEEFLPLLTTRAEPLLLTSRSRIVAHLHAQWPHLDAAAVEVVAESATRLTMSHLVLPLHPPEAVAERVATLVTRYLGESPGGAG